MDCGDLTPLGGEADDRRSSSQELQPLSCHPLVREEISDGIPPLAVWPLPAGSGQCLSLARYTGQAPDPEILQRAAVPGDPRGPADHQRRAPRGSLARHGGERGGPAHLYRRTAQSAGRGGAGPPPPSCRNSPPPPASPPPRPAAAPPP